MARKKCNGNGRMLYVPKPFVEELVFIEKNEKISKSKAFLKMKEHAMVGMAVERMAFVWGLSGDRKKKK